MWLITRVSAYVERRLRAVAPVVPPGLGQSSPDDDEGEEEVLFTRGLSGPGSSGRYRLAGVVRH